MATDNDPSSPHCGLRVVGGRVQGAQSDHAHLIGTRVNVVDNSGCLYNDDAIIGEAGNASLMVSRSRAEGAGEKDLTPPHWSAWPSAGTKRRGVTK